MGDGPLHEVTDEGWDATLQLNLTSQFYSNRAAVRQFRKQGRRRVLNMGSVLGWSPLAEILRHLRLRRGQSAIVGMTKAAASYYAADNIRFNVVAPA